MDKNQVTIWVARDKNGVLCLYKSKPFKDVLYELWDSSRNPTILNPDLFPSVKWEDDEPTEVVLTLKK